MSHQYLQCVVLAGGLGTRMRPITDNVPKALIPILGKPFAEWQLELLASRGIERVVYCIGYRGDMLRERLGNGSQFGVEIEWLPDGRRPLGTAGALRQAVDAGVLDQAFLVLFGDSYLSTDVAAVEDAWRRSGLPALMTVLRNDDRWGSSNVIYADGKVVLYDKARPPASRDQMHWIDYGLSVLNRDIIASRIAPNSVADLADVMRDLSVAGLLAGFEVHERFYEAGSPEGLRDLEEHLRARLERPA